jgi:hypothetical protein
MRSPSALLASVLLVACSSGASPTTGSTSSGQGGASTSSASSGGSSGAGGGAPVPHVEIQGGKLLVDGVPTFLYGGDLHYFRVRDPSYDAAATEAEWAQSMDLMKAAGMNLVTTYAPWDYHAPSAGKWDFSGARDLGRFLDLACQKGLYVVLKPGPNITGEWPRGFGTYGAVPAWWKDAHPASLVKDPSGKPWSYSPTGDPSQRQPTYLDPEYLAAVGEWYDQVLGVARPYLGKCLVAVQVDNETNLYWGDHDGQVDYSDAALGHYRAWLAQKYGNIAALDARYGTSYASFADVAPPTTTPSTTGDRAQNPAFADWYFAGQAYVGDYLATLRSMIEARGFHEPDVLFFTNDSPFALLFTDLKLHDVLLHDGPTKDPVGLSGLDLYPKQFTTNSHLQDQPFQADYFTRLYDAWGDLYTGPQEYAYAAELQGGFYAYPVLGHPDVRPEATDQLLARSIGRGLKGGSFYVIRDGLNADDSQYDYLAAIDLAGNTTTRYDVMKKWGKLLEKRGEELMGTTEVKNRVAILADGRYAAPQAGVLDDMQRLSTIEMPGIFGWLSNAGIDPDVVDARQVTSSELSQRYGVVLFANPDFVDDATAQKLLDYESSGGVLVNLLWPGRVDGDFAPSVPTSTLSTETFPATASGEWVWVGPSRSGAFNATFGAFDGQLTSHWYESFWTAPASPGIVPFAWERTQPFGQNGAIVGYVATDGGHTRAFLGTDVWAHYDQDDYYAVDPAQLDAEAQLARYLVGLGGERPIVSTGVARQLAWARTAPGVLWLFVVNDGAADADVIVHLDAAALGIDPAKSYSVVDELSGTPLPSASGASLAAMGLTVPTKALGTAVVRVTSP